MSNRKRRGRDEGSLYQRGDGLWVGSLSLGYDQAGKHRRRVVYGKTKREAQQKLDKMKRDAAGGMLVEPTRQTVEGYLRQWLEAARPTIRRNTHRCYEGIIRNHVAKHIGPVALSKLTALGVQGLYAAMQAAGDSPRLRHLTHAVLHRAFKQAVRQNLIPRNPCDAVSPPRVARATMKALNADEAGRLLSAAAGDRLEALFVLALATGMRQGELFGLMWPDLDLDAATLSVQRQLEEINGQHALTEPKSARGRRRIDLPAVAVRAMWEHKARMLAEGHLDGPVFCDSRGGFLRKSNFIRQVFKPLLTRAELPDIRFHDLRHTAATLLLAQGVHPKIVQERLGHAQISLTLDTYSHVLPSMGQEAAAKLDGVLARKA
jgi:integrase